VSHESGVVRLQLPTGTVRAAREMVGTLFAKGAKGFGKFYPEGSEGDGKAMDRSYTHTHTHTNTHKHTHTHARKRVYIH
jgi:hypothetical protein